MKNEKLRESLDEMSGEQPLFFDNPSFDKSIIGVSDTGAIIYDYDSMVAELVYDDQISVEEAVDFIDYNTLRALPYAGQTAPIVMYNITSALEDAEVQTDDGNTSEEV